MAATYHSIIKTVKTQGRFAWDYLENFRIYIALKEGTMNILSKHSLYGSCPNL